VAHVIGIVVWVGGLLAATHAFASRLAETTPEGQNALARLQQKLLRGLAHPGAAVAVLAGAAMLVIHPAYFQQGWLHAKLGLVALLILVDLWFTFRVRAFQAGHGPSTAGQARLAHVSIWLLLLAIVIVVVIKP